MTLFGTAVEPHNFVKCVLLKLSDISPILAFFFVSLFRAALLAALAAESGRGEKGEREKWGGRQSLSLRDELMICQCYYLLQ